jgi:acetyl esterase/lipase
VYFTSARVRWLLPAPSPFADLCAAGVEVEVDKVAQMPVGYLIPMALAALGTLFALVPLRRPWALGGMSFYFGPFLNELPFIAFYWILVSTLLAISGSDIDSTGGWAVFGLAVLTSVGLAVVAWRAREARPVVDRALSVGLGEGWRSSIETGLAARLRHRPPLARILLWPFPVRPRTVERVANIRYGDAGRGNLLDVYRHRSQPPGSPVLIHLHGGHFSSGRKSRESLPLLYRVASQGWVCISADYRLSPAARFPDQLIDAKKVIAWVREHGREYGADPTAVFVAGSSAGGHLAASASLTPNDPTFQPGFEDADTSVAAAISLYGYYGAVDEAAGVPTSPVAYVGSDAPPFFVVHGDLDTLAPVEGARLLVERLRSTSSNPVVYAELPGAQHTFDLFHSLRLATVVDGIEAFTAWVRSR